MKLYSCKTPPQAALASMKSGKLAHKYTYPSLYSTIRSFGFKGGASLSCGHCLVLRYNTRSSYHTQHEGKLSKASHCTCASCSQSARASAKDDDATKLKVPHRFATNERLGHILHLDRRLHTCRHVHFF